MSCEERKRLEAMTHAGKSPAQLLTKARILLKADLSEAGEGWSDSAISAALDTSINNIGRLRRRLVEEGLQAALKRKQNPNSARKRIFDGAAEAKLIALTCSPAPEGFARWSLRLLEEKVLYSRDWRPLQARRSANTAESPFADRLPEREAPMCRGYSLAGGNCRVA